MNEEIINKIKALYTESLDWDFDGTAWVSETNYSESIKEFELKLRKIIG